MHRSAFTLLEVLIALVIFALAAVVLGSAYVNVLTAYDAVGRGNARNDEANFARQLLYAEPDRKKAEEGGDFDAADGGHARWHAKIEPTETVDLFQVSFTCEFSEPAGQPPRPPVFDVFMLLRPTWSEGTDAARLQQRAKERIEEMRNQRPL